MIEFNARLFDVTSNRWIDELPQRYTIGYFNGNIEELPQSGEIVDYADITEFEYETTSNLAWALCGAVKTIYESIGEYHTIRMCPNNGDEYYFEYDYIVDRYSIKLFLIGPEYTYVQNWAYTLYTGLGDNGYYPIAIVSVNTIDELAPNVTPNVVYLSLYQLAERHYQFIVCLNSTLSAIANIYNGHENLGTVYYRGKHTSTSQYTTSNVMTVKNNNYPAFAIIVYRTIQNILYQSFVCVISDRNLNNVQYRITGSIYDNTISYNVLPYLSSFAYDGTTFYRGASPSLESVKDTTDYNYNGPLTIIAFNYNNVSEINVTLEAKEICLAYGIRKTIVSKPVYDILKYKESETEPSSDVDPENIPPEEQPPAPIPPDVTDPYYDPTSDPENPDYDPTKDPENPDYDPTEPHTPYRPPSQPTPIIIQPEQVQPPIDPILPPETPPSYVTTNSFFTLYNPSGGDLTNIANFLWSPAWSIDTFKKIFANPLDCILGLMVMPQLPAIVGTKEMNIGNIPTGINLHYFTSQFYDFDCGTFAVMEYYNSYLDYSPYTKINIFLPYIGDKVLNTDEIMNRTIGIKYRFDLATGDCIAFITVDNTVMYSFSGNCASRLPLSASNYGGLVPSVLTAIGAVGTMSGFPAVGTAGALAVTAMKQDIAHTGSISGSAGLMGVQTPYLIITRPRQAFPRNQNSYTGYPSFITENLGSLNGYTEIESCHLEHIPATDDEVKEIERLLKEGVLF